MKLYFIVKNDWQWNFGLEVWSSGINEKEKFILSIRFANLMVFLSYLTVSRILHITYAKVMNFSLYKTRDSVPEAEIWRVRKFVRFVDERYKLLWWWVHSRNVKLRRFLCCVYLIYNFGKNNWWGEISNDGITDT